MARSFGYSFAFETIDRVLGGERDKDKDVSFPRYSSNRYRELLEKQRDTEKKETGNGNGKTTATATALVEGVFSHSMNDTVLVLTVLLEKREAMVAGNKTRRWEGVYSVVRFG